ncbi:hypothetical protein AB6D11_06085 [Vibrio splendidus]
MPNNTDRATILRQILTNNHLLSAVKKESQIRQYLLHEFRGILIPKLDTFILHLFTRRDCRSLLKDPSPSLFTILFVVCSFIGLTAYTAPVAFSLVAVSLIVLGPLVRSIVLKRLISELLMRSKMRSQIIEYSRLFIVLSPLMDQNQKKYLERLLFNCVKEPESVNIHQAVEFMIYVEQGLVQFQVNEEADRHHYFKMLADSVNCDYVTSHKLNDNSNDVLMTVDTGETVDELDHDVLSDTQRENILKILHGQPPVDSMFNAASQIENNVAEALWQRNSDGAEFSDVLFRQAVNQATESEMHNSAQEEALSDVAQISPDTAETVVSLNKRNTNLNASPNEASKESSQSATPSPNSDANSDNAMLPSSGLEDTDYDEVPDHLLGQDFASDDDLNLPSDFASDGGMGQDILDDLLDQEDSMDVSDFAEDFGTGEGEQQQH